MMDILNITQVDAWLTSFAHGDIVGFAGQSWACPIAQCLEETTGATDISVGDQFIVCAINGNRYSEELSGGIAFIKEKVDECGEAFTTAAMLREILDQWYALEVAA